MQGIMHQLQVLVVDNSKHQDSLTKIAELTDIIHDSDRMCEKSILAIKQTSSSFMSNYYWLFFIIIYAGVYLLQ